MGAEKAEQGGPQLAHAVYFTLADNGPAAKAALVQECHTYLKDHPGVDYFAAGTRAEAFDRPVNATDYDVSLMVVFANIEAHDVYQVAPDHLEFIERNKANWKAVKVYDWFVE
jgi:hypothetical protein